MLIINFLYSNVKKKQILSIANLVCSIFAEGVRHRFATERKQIQMSCLEDGCWGLDAVDGWSDVIHMCYCLGSILVDNSFMNDDCSLHESFVKRVIVSSKYDARTETMLMVFAAAKIVLLPDIDQFFFRQTRFPRERPFSMFSDLGSSISSWVYL